MSKKMKSTLVVAIALGISTSFISCSNAQNNNQEIANTVQSTAISKEQAQKVLSAYLEVKEALVQTTGETASSAAEELVTALGDIKDELAGKIRFDAQHIAETKDAGRQRPF